MQVGMVGGEGQKRSEEAWLMELRCFLPFQFLLRGRSWDGGEFGRKVGYWKV
jgi:hypothetical protein